MQTMIKAFLLLIIAFLFLNAESDHSTSGKLIIEVDNIRISEGMVWIGLYDSKENYLIQEQAIVEGLKVNHTGKLFIEVPNLTYGNYALALFHDINNNGELDRNFFGIPSEPYAFSQPLKTKWRLPYFEEVRFSFQHSEQVLITKLKKWHEY
ncbi:MAG: hypothetical protein DHS20C18_10200 [Saprospiraceae bacterium]|nr:MAG: hypothetical protein DHS20C18_10200 [Saprospiraceae bacterium]